MDPSRWQSKHNIIIIIAMSDITFKVLGFEEMWTPIHNMNGH